MGFYYGFLLGVITEIDCACLVVSSCLQSAQPTPFLVIEKTFVATIAFIDQLENPMGGSFVNLVNRKTMMETPVDLQSVEISSLL